MEFPFIRPSNFCTHPWSSVMGQCEYERVAVNIMVILSRTGNRFRNLTWEEYKEERIKDIHGDFDESEKDYFDKVIKYCKSADTARLFSKTWENI